MTNIEAGALLKKFDACDDAATWVRDSKHSPSKLWATCQRADWLLWLAVKIGVDHKLVVLTACACARTALKYVPKGELRPLRAIEAGEGWARGKVSLVEVRRTAAAADAYAPAAAANAAAYAAYAAANAAYAAANAAANDVAAAAAVNATLVRKHIPYSRIVRALRKQGAPKP